MNRLLIFLLLVGLLYALYKYQHIIFGSNVLKLTAKAHSQTAKLPINEAPQIKYNQVTADNISQFSLGSFEDENGSHKAESFLGSLDSCSLNLTDGITLDSKME